MNHGTSKELVNVDGNAGYVYLITFEAKVLPVTYLQFLSASITHMYLKYFLLNSSNLPGRTLVYIMGVSFAWSLVFHGVSRYFSTTISSCLVCLTFYFWKALCFHHIETCVLVSQNCKLLHIYFIQNLDHQQNHLYAAT